MAIEGWYYLHVNGDLIWKGAVYTSVGDLRESDMVRAYWSFKEGDRENAWTILVEALAAGAKPGYVFALAVEWGCDNADARQYAMRANVVLQEDEDGWVAAREDFSDGLGCPEGRGRTCLEAMAELAKELGYKPGGIPFAQLVARPILTATPERKEYEITQEQLDVLIEAAKPTPAMWLSGGTPLFASPQESANAAWERLGDELGFDWKTVEPTSKGQRFFTAVPLRRANSCPTCGSPAPHRHPAMQFEGEVQPCRDPFHLAVTSENTPERILEAQTIGADAPRAALADLLRRFGDVAYREGFLAGVSAYAYSSGAPWAENGVQYVGTTGKTLRQAQGDVEETFNYSAPSKRVSTA